MLHVLLTRCPKSKFDATGDHPQNRDMATEALIPTTPEEAAGLFGDGSSDLTVFAGGMRQSMDWQGNSDYQATTHNSTGFQEFAAGSHGYASFLPAAWWIAARMRG